MKRLAAAAALLAVLATACSTANDAAGTAPSTTATSASSSPSASASASASQTASATSAAVPAYYRQKLSWHGCDPGFQCATLKVPLDYAKPTGRMIDIAVIRKQSSNPAHRIGSLIINPGGPGGSGLDYATCCAGQFASLTTRFDLVSFDPRGVGKSTPVRCVSASELDAYIAVDPTPDDAAEHDRLVASTKKFAQDCQRRAGWLLPHVSTLDQARDMDVLRAALGDRKLTYLGKSYGTYLGVKYAQLFPTRVRALVLDGALDPAASTEDANRVQAKGFEVDLQDFLADCVRRGGCPLGDTQSAADSNLRALAARIDASPLPGGSRRLGPGEFFLGLAAGLYSTESWPSLRYALGQARQGQGRPLLYFTDSLTDRHADGSFGNLVESNTAINCLDRPSQRNVSAYDADARTFAKESPHFGAAIAYGTLPCAFWPVRPVEPAHAVRAAGAPPILVVGTTRDPATPYVWAQAMARQLASGVLLTFNGDGHTAYGRGNRCLDGAVDRYVISLVAPRNGTTCG